MSDYHDAILALDDAASIRPDRPPPYPVHASMPDSVYVWGKRRTFTVLFSSGIHTVHHGLMSLDDVIRFTGTPIDEASVREGGSDEDLVVFEGDQAVALIRYIPYQAEPRVIRLDDRPIAPTRPVPDAVATAARRLRVAVETLLAAEAAAKPEDVQDRLHGMMKAAEKAFLQAMAAADLDGVEIDGLFYYTLTCVSHALNVDALQSCGMIPLERVARLG